MYEVLIRDKFNQISFLVTLQFGWVKAPLKKEVEFCLYGLMLFVWLIDLKADFSSAKTIKFYS
jgi:hypothetical protein